MRPSVRLGEVWTRREKVERYTEGHHRKRGNKRCLISTVVHLLPEHGLMKALS